jgi:hypothetical protein
MADRRHSSPQFGVFRTLGETVSKRYVLTELKARRGLVFALNTDRWDPAYGNNNTGRVFQVSRVRRRAWATNVWYLVSNRCANLFFHYFFFRRSIFLNFLSTSCSRPLHAATTIMQSMNTAVDPCDNFFEFACGNWQNHYVSEPGQANSWFIERTRYISMGITSECVIIISDIA